jgi:predicted component of type VI protein secretion system
MGARYNALLADRTALQLQLQAYAACGDPEVREAVRGHLAHLWNTVAGTTGLDAVTVKTFLAYGMLLNTNAALGLAEVDTRWARGIRTRIKAGLFRHITSRTNR